MLTCAAQFFWYKDINLFISNIDDLELIQNNLETLLSKSET